MLDWRNADRPDDVARQVAESLRRGEQVGLPTAAGYLVAANAADAGAVERLGAGPDGGRGEVELLVAGVAEVERWTGPPSPDVARILNRLWPGPLRLIVPLNRPAAADSLAAKFAPDERLKFRFPRHAAVDAILPLLDFPVIAREVSGAPGAVATAEQLATAWGDRLAVVVDAGPIATQTVTALVVGPDGWRIEQAGGLSEAAVAAAAARWLVFVCTGNTCRSPMTEALCKSLLAARLGCAVDDLPSRGWCVFSAGVAAYPGDGPTPEAVDALRALGADLSAHRSQALSPALVAHADHLIAMTRSHLLAVLSRFPVIGGAMRLLGGAEGDLDDPIGGGADVYAECARTILRHLDRLLTELVSR